MKIPEVYGTNKIRDAKILQMYLDGESETDIAFNIGISTSRVSQIVYRNRGLLNADKTFEKAKRINFLKRLIKRKGGESRKDVADLIDQLRIETEGNKLEHSGKIDGGETTINITPQKTYVFRDARTDRISSLHELESSESTGNEQKI